MELSRVSTPQQTMKEMTEQIQSLTTQLQQAKKEVKIQNQSVKMHSKATDIAVEEIHKLRDELRMAETFNREFMKLHESNKSTDRIVKKYSLDEFIKGNNEKK